MCFETNMLLAFDAIALFKKQWLNDRSAVEQQNA